MRAVDAVQFTNQAAGTTSAFTLLGGKYLLYWKSTAGTSIQLLIQTPDGAYTALSAATASASGSVVFDLPQGSYEIVFTGGSAWYAAIARSPGE